MFQLEIKEIQHTRWLFGGSYRKAQNVLTTAPNIKQTGTETNRDHY